MLYLCMVAGQGICIVFKNVFKNVFKSVFKNVLKSDFKSVSKIEGWSYDTLRRGCLYFAGAN